MNVGNVTSPPAAFRTIQAAPTISDTKTQKLQSQITNAQQRLNHVSSDSQASAQEKAKKRQEIQQQLTELNRQLQLLRQKQEAEEREAAKEEAQKEVRKSEEKQIFTEEMFEQQTSPSKEDKKSAATGQSQTSLEDVALPSIDMQKIYSAEAYVRQSEVQDNVTRQKEGRMNVLEAEIKSDKLYGTDPQDKREALSKMRSEAALVIEEIGQPDSSNPLGIHTSGKIIITE